MAFDPDKLTQRIEAAEKLIGTIIPAVSAGGAMVRLLVKTLRPKLTPDQKKEFDEAIAEAKAAHAKLGEDLAAYQQVRNGIVGDAPQPQTGSAAKTDAKTATASEVSGMTTADHSGLSKEQ